ncbi:hypothetical protein BB560_000244 [Smittium megazygosporum]|uniref:AMP-dependent synthetase/ligase domain-containing protein n=1 Tax=Smittium megazygosporum TaxID=133381 RepID=A0A2T9ZKV9_9FUNG|nr:hypothetical protein BB560_000244 [Smittium megazygosporum]
MNYSAQGFKSYVVPDSARPGFTPILRNLAFYKDSMLNVYPELETIYDLFWGSVEQVPDRDFIGHRPYDPETGNFLPYVFQTYKQVGERVTNASAGFIKAMLMLSKTEQEKQKVLARKWPIAIYSINRPEWKIADKACVTQSLYSVALYDTLGYDSMLYILDHCEAPMVVCSLDKIPKIMLNIGKLPRLKIIVCMDSLKDSQHSRSVPSPFNTNSIRILREWTNHCSIKLYDMEEIEELGKSSGIPHFPPKPEDIYTVLYTSGTTGNPKGVVSTHSNYVHSVKFGSIGRLDRTNTQVVISYLPLAHTYGRQTENLNVFAYGKIGYFCGDISKILEDTRALQPTSFPGIPRLLSRFYDEIRKKTIDAPGITGKIYRKAVAEKLAKFKKTGNPRDEFWDPTLFKPIKSMISDRLTAAGSGSASIEPKVLDFLRVVFAIDMIEGFGMTETSAVGLKQVPGDPSSGNIGTPLPGIEIRLKDVPEMNYLSTDTPCARGELLIRSKTIFREYLKEPEQTREVMLEGNWFATGDIARINEDGSISIIDRKKSIFKLSQGEYLAPERLENTLSKHPLVSQSFVYGRSTKSYPVGVIVPDPLTFVPWATKIVGNKTFEELVKDPKVVSEVLKEIQAYSRRSKMNGFEILRNIHLEHIPFDADNNQLLTPTLKLRRFDAAKYYNDILENLYEE